MKQELPKCSCNQHVTASFSINNCSLFHLHDPRRPSLSSPALSLSYKSDKYSATMANVTVGSTLEALPTTCRSSENTPRTAVRGWKCHSCTRYAQVCSTGGRMKCSVGCEKAAISPGSCCTISRLDPMARLSELDPTLMRLHSSCNYPAIGPFRKCNFQNMALSRGRSGAPDN